MHIKDLKNSVQVQPPGSDRFSVRVLLVQKPRDWILFTPLDDVRLDLDHSATVERFVSKHPEVNIADSTHIISCSIALRADGLG